jgi:uncharacterized protein (DUF302 family)
MFCRERFAMSQLLAHFFRLAALLVLSSTTWAAAPAKSAPQAASAADVYKIAIDRNVSLQEAADSMRLRANALNLKLVAELPLSKQVEAITGQEQKTITIFQFCDAVTAKKLIDLNLDFSVYMPCRIALIENEKGEGWLVMMDVNTAAIAKEKQLPKELQKKINEVRTALIDIMKAGAAGDL